MQEGEEDEQPRRKQRIDEISIGEQFVHGQGSCTAVHDWSQSKEEAVWEVILKVNYSKTIENGK